MFVALLQEFPLNPPKHMLHHADLEGRAEHSLRVLAGVRRDEEARADPDYRAREILTAAVKSMKKQEGPIQ